MWFGKTKTIYNDMKHIYNAPNKQKAALNDFTQKVESKYAYAIKSWRTIGTNLYF